MTVTTSSVRSIQVFITQEEERESQGILLIQFSDSQSLFGMRSKLTWYLHVGNLLRYYPHSPMSIQLPADMKQVGFTSSRSS